MKKNKDMEKDDSMAAVKEPKKLEYIRITNMQRCSWIVPPQFFRLRYMDSRCFVDPLQSVVVEKSFVQKYKSVCLPFRKMVEMGLLVITDERKVVNADERDLNSAPIKEPPAFLKGEGDKGKRSLEICHEPVTVKYEKAAAQA